MIAKSRSSACSPRNRSAARSGRAVGELELRQRGGRPQQRQPRSQRAAELLGLGRVRPALVGAAAPRQQPGEPRDAEGELRLLPALARELDRLAVRRVRARPPVRRRLVAGDQVEHARQRAHGRALARGVERVGEQRPAGARLAQEDRPDRQPGEEVRVVAQRRLLLRERDRRVDAPRAGRRVVAEHLRHAERRAGEEPRARRDAGPGERRGALRRGEHLHRLAGVQAGAARVGQHRHGRVRLGLRRRGDEHRVPAHHGAAPDRDLAGQPVDADAQRGVGGRRAGLGEQGDGALHEAREPRGLGRVAQQPRAVLAVRRRAARRARRPRRRRRTRCGRGRGRPRARARPTRSRRCRTPPRRDATRGGRGRGRAGRRRARGGRRAAASGGAAAYTAERASGWVKATAPPPSATSPRCSAAASAARSTSSAARRALQQRRVAAVARRGEDEGGARRGAEPVHPRGVGLGDPRGHQHRRALARERGLRPPGRAARAARAGCRPSPGAAAPPPPGRRRPAAPPSPPGVSPAIGSTGRSAPSSSDGAPGRTASSTAIGSATSRRAAKSSAWALEWSSHCASSTSTATGCSSASAASSPSVAAPTAKRSCAGPGRIASADSSAAACGGGRRSTSASAGRSSSSSEANGICASDSIPRARSTRIRDRRARGVIEQRGLADPGLAGECEHGALARPRRRQRAADRLALALAAHEHGPTLPPGLAAPKTRGAPEASDGGPGIRSRHDHPGQRRRSGRRQAHAVRVPRGRRGRRDAERGARRDGRQARPLPRARRGRADGACGAGAADRHRRALRARVVQRPGGGRLPRLRPRVRPVRARPRAGRRVHGPGEPGVPAGLLPARARRGDRLAADHRGRAHRRRARLARARARCARRLRAVLPPRLQRQPHRGVAARARRRRREARARRPCRRRRLRPRVVDDPDGGVVPALAVRGLRLPRGLDRDRAARAPPMRASRTTCASRPSPPRRTVATATTS